MNSPVGLRGFGYSVPEHIRYNDDPIFDNMISTVNSQGISEKELFIGMEMRRYLGPDESIVPHMIEAARQAIDSAGLVPEQIDRLYGYASVSDYITPNALYAVHADLGLSPNTLVVPINNEFSNFLTSIIQAWEGILTGHSENSLVVCGSNWTQFMNYEKGHSASIGDGAGAVCVGISNRFVVVDYAVETLSEQYGVMNMQHRAEAGRIKVDDKGRPIPTYDILPEAGIQSFQITGMEGPPRLVKKLLAKHGLSGQDIALISHQASRNLLNRWAEDIQPRQYFETFERYGNMTLASYPVTLAVFADEITADYLVIVALGVGFHQVAVLFKRAM